MFKDVAQCLYDITADGGVVVWVVGDATINGSETGTSFRQALHFKEIGFNLHDTMIYEKNSSSFPASKTSKRYTQIFEYMFIFTKGEIRDDINLLCDKKKNGLVLLIGEIILNMTKVERKQYKQHKAHS